MDMEILETKKPYRYGRVKYEDDINRDEPKNLKLISVPSSVITRRKILWPKSKHVNKMQSTKVMVKMVERGLMKSCSIEKEVLCD